MINSKKSKYSNCKNKKKLSSNCYNESLPKQCLKSDLKKEFIYFCQTTTIRGVTRVVNARNKAMQIVWIMSVIMFFFGVFICMFILTRQYLEYNVIHPPQVSRDTPSPFPSMTLCNLRPMSSEAFEILSNLSLKTPRQFAIDVNNFAAKSYYYTNNTYSYQLVTNAISMGGYLESLSIDTAVRLGHNLSHTIIHCMVIHAEGSKRVMNECNQIGRWRRFIHAQYLNCYTYDLYEFYRNNVRTIELFVYLDQSMNVTFCSDCFGSEIKSQLSGAVVTVHNAETYPDVNQEGINIQPGSLTEIKIKTIKHVQKTPPYGRCSPNTRNKIELYNSETYAYSEHACRMSTIQSKINSLCGCNAIEFPYLNSSLPFCLSMVSFVKKGHCDLDNNNQSQSNRQCLAELEAVKSKVLCKSEVTKQYQGDIVPSCTLPCAFFAYETDRSTSTWPTKAWQLSWLSTKAGRKVVNRPDLANYRKAMKLMSTPDGQHEAQKLLSESNVLERNLLAIMLIRPNFNLHKVEEKEVLSLTSLLSQAGGLFSIWIGLNMMSVIEVVELFIHLFCKCNSALTRHKKKTKQTDANHMLMSNMPNNKSNHPSSSRTYADDMNNRSEHVDSVASSQNTHNIIQVDQDTNDY